MTRCKCQRKHKTRPLCDGRKSPYRVTLEDVACPQPCCDCYSHKKKCCDQPGYIPPQACDDYGYRSYDRYSYRKYRSGCKTCR